MRGRVREGGEVRSRRACLRDLPRLGVALLALGLLGGCMPAAPAAAPGSARIYRVGLLRSGLAESGEVVGTSFDPFIARLGELGYTEGENLVIEGRRLAQPATDEANPVVFAELIALRVDVLVVGSPTSVQAAMAASSSVPIVMLGLPADPVARGFVQSLARPGGNVTGVLGALGEAGLKRLQLLSEAVPGISRVAVLGTPANREFREAAEQSLKIEAFNVPLAPEGWEATLERATEQGADAIFSTGATSGDTALIGALSARYRLPGIFPIRRYVEGGGLIAYEARGSDIQRRAADYVDRILRGAKPADLPVELPTRYDLIVNMRTARALGITFPPAFLAQVDEVIE